MAATRKILMKKRETRAKRAVTFSKRPYGLLNKAAELCILSGAQIAIVVSSPCSKQNIFSFGHPSVDSVFNAFLHSSVPPPVDDGIKLSAVSLRNEIKELEQVPEYGKNKIGGLLKDFEDLEEDFESIDELLAVEEKMENLKNNAMVRLSELLSSKVFALGRFGVNYVHNSNYSNGIKTTLASEFSHLDQILINGDNNSVFNPYFPGKIGNNSFYNANVDSSSDAVYPDGSFLSGEKINQGVEFGAMAKSIFNPEAYFINQGVNFGAMAKSISNPEAYLINQGINFGAMAKSISNPEAYFINQGFNFGAMAKSISNPEAYFINQDDSGNLQAMSGEYENKELPFYSAANLDQISTADFGHQYEAVPLATVDQFGQFFSYSLPYFFH